MTPLSGRSTAGLAPTQSRDLLASVGEATGDERLGTWSGVPTLNAGDGTGRDVSGPGSLISRPKPDLGARALRVLLGEVHGSGLLRRTRRHIAEHQDVLTEGYATTAEHDHRADYHWICKPCFDDFADRFQWHIVASTD